MMLLSAQFIVFMQHSRIDFVAASRSLAKRAAMGREFAGQGFVLPIVTGIVLGAVLGYLSRRLIRIFPRLVFFCSLLPILWIFVHAFVLRRFAPSLAETLPFGPLAAGAVVYGIFLAVAAPVRVG
jgi:NhaP-type Na+/H+ or K+/H+ antiporter